MAVVEGDAVLPALPDIQDAGPWPTLSVPAGDRPQLGVGAIYWLATLTPAAGDAPGALQVRALPHADEALAENTIAVYRAETDGKVTAPSVIIGSHTHQAESSPVAYGAERPVPVPVAEPVPPPTVPAAWSANQSNWTPSSWTRSAMPGRWQRWRNGGKGMPVWLAVFLLYFGVNVLGTLWHTLRLLPFANVIVVGTGIIVCTVLYHVMRAMFAPRRRRMRGPLF